VWREAELVAVERLLRRVVRETQGELRLAERAVEVVRRQVERSRVD
jgi:hypothetical protein